MQFFQILRDIHLFFCLGNLGKTSYIHVSAEKAQQAPAVCEKHVFHLHIFHFTQPTYILITPSFYFLFLQSLQDLEDEGDMLQDLQTRRQQRKQEVHVHAHSLLS